MTVTVAAEVWSAWPDLGGSADLLLRSPADQASVLRTLKAAEERATGGEELPRIVAYAPTPAGICLSVEDGGDLRALLEPLTEALGAAGVQGRIELHDAPPATLPGLATIDAGLWECRAALAPQPDRPDSEPFWVIAPEAVRRVVTAAVAWAMAGNDVAHAYTGSWWRSSDRRATADALALAATADPYGGGTLTVTRGDRFRHVVCRPWMGFVSLSSGPMTSVAVVADAESLLRILATIEPDVTYGFLRKMVHPSLLGATWEQNLRWPDTDPGAPVRVAGQRRVEDAFPLREHPAQLVRGPAAPPAGGPGWTVRAVGTAWLVVADDLTAWATREPT